METPPREVYDFPTRIPLKVIGRNEDNFEAFVLDLFRLHVADLDIYEVVARISRGDTYLSVTVNFLAQSRDQLDSLYREFSQSPRVKIVI